MVEVAWTLTKLEISMSSKMPGKEKQESNSHK